MASRKVKGLCCVGGRYRRTLGKFVNTKGKVAPKKFLLGTDLDHAERANLRLEQLWRDIEKRWNDLPDTRMCDDEPIWVPETLHFAEAIRKGRRMQVPPETVETGLGFNRTPSGLAHWFWGIKAMYPSIADLIEEPVNPEFTESKESAASCASQFAAMSTHYAEISSQPIAAAAPGQTLHLAIDDWAEDVRRLKTRHDGKLIEGGRKIIEAAHRFKNTHDDMPLTQLNYQSVKAIVDFWCSRPPSKAKGKGLGKPVSVVHVQNTLSYLRRFLVWLHRSGDFDWRDSDRIIDDACSQRQARILQTPEEVKKSAEGPDAWTIDELKRLYEYATDRERLYLLLGINGGFAQSEIIHLMKDEIHVEHSPPDVRYTRHKSKKPAMFTLWPETRAGLEWGIDRLPAAKAAESVWAVTNTNGDQLVRQRISNAWNNLLDRVQRHHPGFRRLPFKMLRKTNATLLSKCGADSEVIAIVQGRAKRTPHDDQADVYYPRFAEKVHPALTRLHEQLKPMFDVADEPFPKKRKYPRPGRSLTPEKVKQLRALREGGMKIVDVAKEVGCSPSAVSMYTRKKSA